MNAGAASAFDLEFRLFGPPRLIANQRELTFRRRQPLAILSVLALNERPITRDELCYLLWPDAPQDVARQRLRRSLSELRRVIGPPATRLLFDATGSRSILLKLNPHLCHVDARDFIQLSTQAHHMPDPSGLRAAELAARIGAEPLLKGFELDDAPEFENWLLEQRERFTRLKMDTLRRMIRGYVDLKDYPRAVATVAQALALDELAEDLHCKAIWLYAAIGRRSEAVRQFARCASLLERELAIEPDEATRAVYQAVLEGRIDEVRPLAFGLTSGDADRRPTWLASSPDANPPSPAYHLRLADIAPRAEAAERELTEAIAQALQHMSNVLWIQGPTGAPASALVEQAVKTVRKRQPDLNVWEVSGHAITADAPLDLMCLLLDAAAREYLTRVRESATLNTTPLNLWMSEAVRLLPELRAIFPQLPHPSALLEEKSPTTASRRLLQALPRVLLALTDGRPTAVVLRDVDCADAASVEAIGWLARGLAGSRMALIITCRDAPHAAPEALQALLGDLQAQDMLRLWFLPPLSQAAIATLVQRCNLPADFAETIWACTAGAPRSVLDMLRAASAPNAQLPDSWHAAIQINLNTLDSTTRQVLETLAIFGNATVPALEHLSRRGLADVERACEALTEEWHWLTRCGDRYAIATPEIRHAVLDALSPARRQQLHRQAADLLYRHHADPSRIAHHLAAAGQPNRAAALWLAAARRARERYAYPAALGAIQRGLALARKPELQFDLLCLQESLLRESGQPEQQAIALDALQQLANATPHCSEWQAEVHYRRGQNALARSAWDEAIDALQRASACTLHRDSRILMALGRALAQRHRWSEAESTFQQALMSARQDDPNALAHVWLTWAEIEQLRERYDAAKAALNRAVALVGARSPLLPKLMLARGTLASVCGEFATALTYGQEALRLFAQRGLPDAEANAQTLIARMCARLGRINEALAAYAAAYAGYAALDLRQGMAAARVNASTLALRSGDFEQGIALAREAYALFEAIQDARGLCVAASNIGAAYVWLGQGAEGERWLRESYARASEVNLPAQQAAALANLGAALLQQDRLDEARARMEQGLALRSAQGHLDVSIDRAFLAIACLRLGDLPSADAHSAQAIADLERMPHVENPQQVWFARAQVLRASDQAGGESRAALAQAVAHLQQVEAALPETQREHYRSAFAFNRAILRAFNENIWPDPPSLT
ncbi:MAG: SARP family transcriptional regulator [Candidatus Roseilinea sp.]|nr:MAG: SARP family transcriptional regulator [Candidatus Roseilinea sp.]